MRCSSIRWSSTIWILRKPIIRPFSRSPSPSRTLISRRSRTRLPLLRRSRQAGGDHQCRGGGTEDLHCCRCTGRGKPQDCRKPVGASDRVPEDPEMGRQAAHRQRRQCTGQHRPGRVSKYTNRGQGGGSALST